MRVATIGDIDERARSQFFEDGFLAVDRLIDAGEVAALRSAYQEIIQRRVHARGDRMLGGRIHQVMFPSMDHAAWSGCSTCSSTSPAAPCTRRRGIRM